VFDVFLFFIEKASRITHQVNNFFYASHSHDLKNLNIDICKLNV